MLFNLNISHSKIPNTPPFNSDISNLKKKKKKHKKTRNYLQKKKTHNFSSNFFSVYTKNLFGNFLSKKEKTPNKKLKEKNFVSSLSNPSV